MSVKVTVTDVETGDTEEMELDRVSHILVLNEAAGFFLHAEQRWANGTIQLTIKRGQPDG